MLDTITTTIDNDKDYNSTWRGVCRRIYIYTYAVMRLSLAIFPVSNLKNTLRYTQEMKPLGQ